MCGIFCSIVSKENDEKQNYEWNLCEGYVSARGPDKLNGIKQNLTEEWNGLFYGSLLWMQGLKPVPQPLIDEEKNILLWNGDVFRGSLFQENTCDSINVLNSLKNSNNVSETLKEIIGPFSFIYYNSAKKMLYFGRDRFGRHSLLIEINQKEKSLLLTSVGTKKIKNISELPALGIFVADFSNNENIEISLIPWFESNDRLGTTINDFNNKYSTNIKVLTPQYLPSVKKVFNFSLDNHLGFLKFLSKIDTENNSKEIMDYFLSQKCIFERVENLLHVLNDSVKIRVNTLPKICKNCTSQSKMDISCSHARVGILFSGGLDSAVLAAIAHKNINTKEPIDLINVTFQKKSSLTYESPDRLTGRKTLMELEKLYPSRQFNFIEVNISEDELVLYRSSRISDLSYPNSTVLDESLACAIWFASRGKGFSTSANNFYESSCRVLLLGMGADEQFGGYMRHRTILKRQGWNALNDELNLEFDRISSRNLGRDDRIVSDHGRQSRLPYLDEAVVNFIQNIPPWERCCPVDLLPPGIGDKLLLRLLAWQLKLFEAALIPKKAIQFGSRIADKKENAKDLSKNL